MAKLAFFRDHFAVVLVPVVAPVFNCIGDGMLIQVRYVVRSGFVVNGQSDTGNGV